MIRIRGRTLKTVSVEKTVARIEEQVTLKARSETIIPVRCSQQAAMVSAGFMPTMAFKSRGIYAANCCVTPNVNGVFLIKVLNTNVHEVRISKRQVCGQLRVPSVAYVDSIDFGDITSNDEQQRSFENVVENDVTFGSQLTDSQKQALLSLLNQHSKVFAGDPKKPTKTNLVTHTIPTGDHQPIKSKRSTIPYAWEDEVRKQLTEMLKNNIIRP